MVEFGPLSFVGGSQGGFPQKASLWMDSRSRNQRPDGRYPVQTVEVVVLASAGFLIREKINTLSL